MGFLELLFVASFPVIKVLLVTALGLFLALDSINLLGENARKHVNHVSTWNASESFISFFFYCVFSPSLAKDINNGGVFFFFSPLQTRLYFMCSILHWWAAIWPKQSLLKVLFCCEYQFDLDFCPITTTTSDLSVKFI